MIQGGPHSDTITKRCAISTHTSRAFRQISLHCKRPNTEAALTKMNRRAHQPLHNGRQQLNEREFYYRLPDLKHSPTRIPFKIVAVYQRRYLIAPINSVSVDSYMGHGCDYLVRISARSFTMPTPVHEFPQPLMTYGHITLKHLQVPSPSNFVRL